MKKPKKITPKAIWNEYLRGEDYHQQIRLHEIVKRNEKFYEGEQWEGLYCGKNRRRLGGICEMKEDRKEYYKQWREKNKEHIKQYKKEYAKTHDSSFKKCNKNVSN